MEQFSLEKYLENPNRKITTRYGNREVRIICTDRKAKLPIVALMVDMDGNEYVTYHTKNGWCSAEEKYPDKRDLFFADEEEELTEFDYAVLSIISDHNSHTDSIEAFAKRSSKKLLDLARKEILKEFRCREEQFYRDGFEKGTENALKSLPKWKKAKKDEELDCHVAIQQDDRVVLSDFVQKDEYYITLDVLKRLPKEEL